MAHITYEQHKISRFAEWYKAHQLFTAPVVWLIGSFVALFGVYEVFDYFSIKFLDDLVKPFVLFVLISVILSLSRIIVYLLKNYPKLPAEISNELVENDSIIAMLKEAESHSRWAEIIKIGSSLSDVLWFTSRKKLRVAIGHFMEVAAQQSNDTYTLSATLIEDLGNTYLGLGKPDKGITYINRGIKIAEKNNYPFLIMRGYRNLSCCYSFKNDPTSALTYLGQAETAATTITDPINKLEALGAMEYARCKVYKKQGDFSKAVNTLDAATAHYNSLSLQYPDTKKRNDDRLVKIYREKGALYLSMNTDEATDNAYDSLSRGLQLAQETLNYDNIIVCCTFLAEIQIKRGALEAAEGMINIAKACVDKIDTPSIIDDYNQTLRKLEVEKYAS